MPAVQSATARVPTPAHRGTAGVSTHILAPSTSPPVGVSGSASATTAVDADGDLDGDGSGDEAEGDSVFVCPLCPFTTQYRFSIVRHRRMPHENLIVDDGGRVKGNVRRLYRCPHCQHMVTDVHNLRLHVDKRHGPGFSHDPVFVPPLECPQGCGYATMLKLELRRHLETSHGIVDSSFDAAAAAAATLAAEGKADAASAAASKRLSCRFCPYTSFSEPILKRHEERKHAIACPMCSFTTDSQASLDAHVETDHATAPSAAVAGGKGRVVCVHVCACVCACACVHA